MARIFLSHSSIDNATAIALRDWLVAQGWDDLFLDLDPERGIGAGERWERALNEAAHRCEAVLFLVSTPWLNSAWCMREFRLASRLNKRMFGVLIEDLDIKKLPAELTSTWQMVNLATGPGQMFRATMLDGSEEHVVFANAGLARLKTGLSKAGLDSRFFAWPPKHDPERPPYRGLRPLEADDAGIFFGREAPIIEMLDRLRGLRDSAPPRFLTILGASGAGKSSFLRAGLIPRLIRDDRNFLVLPIIRPERAAISGEMGLIHSLEIAAKAVGVITKRAELKKVLAAGAEALRALIGDIAKKAAPPRLQDEADAKPPTIILAVDQGEELFQADGSEEAQTLLTLLRDLAAAPSPDLIVLFTIRSDSYERLQTAGALDGLRQQTMSLPPLPKGAYQTVIEGPANRLRDTKRALKIEPQLTQALLAGIESGGAKDALPLLAFTLERLYLEHGGDGDLKLSDYEEIGGIAGSIEASVERVLKAADSNPAIPRDRVARLALMRRAFIPWLAGIDPETGSPRRAIARLSEIPEESRPLVQHLIDQHLLATDVSAKGERTVEPAHEALLRQWDLLQGWLKEDFAHLSSLEGVKRATRDWLANKQSPDWLAHAAGRLEDAETLNTRPDLAGKLETADRDYLSACRASETERKEKDLDEARQLAEAQRKIAEEQQRYAEEQRRNAEASRKAAVRLRMVAIVAIVLALISIATAVYGYIKAQEASEQRHIAEKSAQEAEAQAKLAEQKTKEAQEQSELAVKKSQEAEANLAEALRRESLFMAEKAKAAIERKAHMLAVLIALEGLPDARRSVRRPSVPELEILLDTALMKNRQLRIFEGHPGPITAMAISPDGSRLVTASEDHTARLWDSAGDKEIAVLNGHKGTIYSAKFSPDGKRIATASWDKTVRLWDGADGHALPVLSGHDAAVRSAEFSGDGTRIVTASGDSTAKIWDAQTGALLSTLSGHSDAVDFALFNNKGDRIATVSRDRTARIWDARTGAALLTLSDHTKEVLSAAFSVDDRLIVTTSEDGTACIWDAANGAPLAVLKGHTNAVTSATLSNDGSRVLTASRDKTARLWNASTGSSLRIFKGHRGVVNAAKFSADESQLLTASDDHTVRLWDVRSGAVLQDFAGHTDAAISALFTPGSRRIASASRDKTAALWDARTDIALVDLIGHRAIVTAASFSPDGSRVLTASADKTARLWDAASGKMLVTLAGHQGSISWAAMSSDGKHIVTGGDDDTVRVWDAGTGTQIAVLSGHKDVVVHVAISPDSKTVASSSWDRTARLWDMETGSLLRTLTHNGAVLGSSFSPDGAKILTASEDRSAVLWDVKTGEKLKTFAHESTVTYVGFSPDGSLLITASDDKTAKIYDAETGELLAMLQGHLRGVRSASFSPESTRIVTASSDGTARIWNPRTGELLMTLTGHAGPITRAVFSPEGERIATSSWDGTARIWDAATGKAVAVFAGHQGTIRSVAFNKASDRIVTGSSDGTAKIWRIYRNSQELIDAARASLTRCLSDSERADIYLPARMIVDRDPRYCMMQR